ncbi:hypothetical protein MRX96_041279 [Rhipicephalus microplus]
MNACIVACRVDNGRRETTDTPRSTGGVRTWACVSCDSDPDGDIGCPSMYVYYAPAYMSIVYTRIHVRDYPVYVRVANEDSGRFHRTTSGIRYGCLWCVGSFVR